MENTMLYRYMTFEQFANMLETGTLYMNRVTSWPDKHELQAIREAYISKHRYVDVSDKDYKFILMELGLANVYAQCWSRSSTESNAMWELYSKRLGVRIGTTVADIGKAIYDSRCYDASEWELHHFPIEYSDGSLNVDNHSIIGADAYLEVLQHKRKAFAYEDEYRFVLLNRAGLDSIGEILMDMRDDNNAYRSLCNKAVIKYPIDLSMIKEIVIDYRAPGYHRETIRSMCSDKGILNKLTKSQLL